MNAIEPESEKQKYTTISRLYEKSLDVKCLVMILNGLFDGMKEPEELKDSSHFSIVCYQDELINCLKLIKQIKKELKRLEKGININFESL